MLYFLLVQTLRASPRLMFRVFSGLFWACVQPQIWTYTIWFLSICEFLKCFILHVCLFPNFSYLYFSTCLLFIPNVVPCPRLFVVGRQFKISYHKQQPLFSPNFPLVVTIFTLLGSRILQKLILILFASLLVAFGRGGQVPEFHCHFQ